MSASILSVGAFVPASTKPTMFLEQPHALAAAAFVLYFDLIKLLSLDKKTSSFMLPPTAIYTTNKAADCQAGSLTLFTLILIFTVQTRGYETSCRVR